VKRLLLIGWAVLAGVILLIDYEAGSDVILTVILCIPVALAAWFNGRGWGLGFAVATSVLHLCVDLIEPHVPALPALLVNDGAAFATFALLAVLIDLVARQRSELEAMNHEKNLVLKEVHHRVKNNLQVISSLLSLEAGKINNPEAAVVFKECRDRIHLMARLHERLCSKEKFSAVDLSAHLRETAQTLLDAHSPNGCQISLKGPDGSLIVDIDTAMTLGLIANEVILNSLKHAFTARESGCLTINLTDGPRREMVISDDGSGLPQDFTPKKRGSFGLELINGLSHQIQGEAKLTNAESGGTCTTITFPNPAPTT